MLRYIATICFMISPVAAAALCDGKDLIGNMPTEQRQELRQLADNAPYGTGLLWRATRGDTEITWFGTYHYKHRGTDVHLEMLQPLIDAAEIVYLEVSNDDTLQMQRDMAVDPSMMFITEGPTLPDLLGEADWQTYKKAMADRAIPSFMAAKFKPMWAAMMLGIGPCEARNGVMEEDGIDKLLGDYAEQIGNPSRSLEDFKTVLAMLDSFPEDEQLDMIRLFFAWPIDADDMAYTLRERYLLEDVAMIWEFSKQTSLQYGGPDALEDFQLFEKLLLTDRNAAWVDLLLEEADGKSVFAAVGAAHLPGEVGVLYLLEQQGFEIERLPFDF